VEPHRGRGTFPRKKKKSKKNIKVTFYDQALPACCESLWDSEIGALVLRVDTSRNSLSYAQQDVFVFDAFSLPSFVGRDEGHKEMMSRQGTG
jgi:hypothetical protein